MITRQQERIENFIAWVIAIYVIAIAARFAWILANPVLTGLALSFGWPLIYWLMLGGAR